ncbi:hypothetical protein BJ138DRAFT_1118043 [Hygrophoropsis aurantiaca]|uniref:Uncharacterized protein n=1 Tax=Hygrophoropsis aurantiaca TaxID=72124 RepID=A0ACB7ZYG3_9AGAM|nr:hypothetical protein BJ138DRAFT_1118043 [Hygrophoropsis aurantiaca]
MSKKISTNLTPAQKAAEARAAKKAAVLTVPGDVPDLNSPRPRRQAMNNALTERVWLSDKPTKRGRKRASSTVPESGKVKQLRTGHQEAPQESEPASINDATSTHTSVPLKNVVKYKVSNKQTMPVNNIQYHNEAGDDDTASSESGADKIDEDPIKELSDDSDDDGLEGLTRKPDLLKAQLESEIPVFSNSARHSKSTNHLVSSSSLAARSASVSSGNRVHSRNSSTTSSKSFADGPNPSESSDFDEYPSARQETVVRKVSHYRTSSKSSLNLDDERKIPHLKKGKREAARDLEKPKWNDHSDVDGSKVHGHTGGANSQSHKGPRTETRGSHLETWPDNTHLRYTDDGKVNLKIQQPHIQALLRGSISAIQKYLVFEDAYPLFDDKEYLMRNLLLESAQDDSVWKTQLQDVCTRIKRDAQYVGELASVPLGRVSTIRGNVEKIASRHIISSYGLNKDSDDEIARLLQDDNFIFPLNAKASIPIGEPNTSKPYQHPAIIETLGEAFFDNKTSAGVKFHEHFTSTWDGSTDPELSVAMVALAATAVHAALVEFRTNDGRRSHGRKGVADFNSSVYSGIFKHHVDILNGVYQQSARSYHKIMAGMFKTVSGSRNAAASAATSTLLRIKLDDESE